MRPCNIIFEGMPRVGKTTALAKFSNMLGIKIKKYSNPKTKNETYNLFLNYFLELGRNENEIQCWDRGHLSELVYGPLYRPANYLDPFLPNFILACDKALWRGFEYAGKLKTIIVYFYPLSQHILNYEGREQYKDNFAEQAILYENALRNTNLNVIRICTHEVRPGKVPNWKSTDNIHDELLIKLRGH